MRDKAVEFSNVAGEVKEGLLQAYEKIKEFSSKHNIPIDSLEVINEVDELRSYWMPKEVKVILLAESHVLTSNEDFRIEIDYSNFRDLIPNYPDRFVRFVYCIGYSESDILKNPPCSSLFRNPGTWQYWKIFCACTSNSEQISFDYVLKSRTTNYVERIRNKIDILKRMKEMGVWLVDSSVVGINGRPNKIKKEIILLSWNNYVKDIALNKNPKAIVFIGKPVKDALQDEIDDSSVKTFFQPQPQAFLSSERQTEVLKEYYRICSRYCLGSLPLTKS